MPPRGAVPGSEEVDVRYLFLDVNLHGSYKQLLARLQPEERERAGAFLHIEDRLAFCAGRVLARHMLSERAAEPAEGWRFEQNSYGKPALSPAVRASDLRFNISHCAGLVAVAVSLGHEVGVDVEQIDPSVDCLGIAREQFSQSEFALVDSSRPTQRPDTFFALWTLKEAYVKARGEGLSLPLSLFSFTLNPPVIAFDPVSDDDPQAWQFWQTRPAPSYLLAVAAHRGAGTAMRCRIRAIELSELTESSE